MSTDSTEHRLLAPIDFRRDHARGDGARNGGMTVLIYGDYLCPYCRRLRQVLDRLRRALGERMVYVFRHYPNERAHPGSELASIAAEAAGQQGRFWEMHDALYEREPTLVDKPRLLQIAGSLGLDTERFELALDDPKLRQRVQEDLTDGRRNGVTATPTIFIDGIRYDGAWDFYSMLEALERPIGAQVKRTARAFANLPTSAGLVVLIAAAAAIACANSPLQSAYHHFLNAQLSIGPAPGGLSLSVGQWCSEGLLAIFYAILGLEIRREMTAGSLANSRAALVPLIAGVSGIVVSAGVYLALNSGATAAGWPITADTGIPFTLGILAVFGARASAGLKVFVAAYAIANDLSSTLILALLHPRAISLEWLLVAFGTVATMATFTRWRIYAVWPYLMAALGLWLSLHLAGVSGALSGLALAAFLPPWPAPAAAPLLAQAASALAELEHAEHELERTGKSQRRLEQEPVWDWATRNLRAAADRLQSPAERVERATEPWSTYVVLPIFAFTATGVGLAADFRAHDAARVFGGVVLALAIGKPIGIILTTWAAAKAKIAFPPADATPLAFLGAVFLCGIADPFSFYLADQTFQTGAYASVAKLGVLAGSGVAAAFGAVLLGLSPIPGTDRRATLETSRARS
ncbi:MAG: Na(+)/H(+) antiporter NhaA [Gammaproteobacteria bacterium]|nr:Na(+)/H(+) antiporter NhaA [Gammaproteobacteria bacterium]